jgi:hypothetical protein
MVSIDFHSLSGPMGYIVPLQKHGHDLWTKGRANHEMRSSPPSRMPGAPNVAHASSFSQLMIEPASAICFEFRPRIVWSDLHRELRCSRTARCYRGPTQFAIHPLWSEMVPRLFSPDISPSVDGRRAESRPGTTDQGWDTSQHWPGANPR